MFASGDVSSFFTDMGRNISWAGSPRERDSNVRNQTHAGAFRTCAQVPPPGGMAGFHGLNTTQILAPVFHEFAPGARLSRPYFAPGGLVLDGETYREHALHLMLAASGAGDPNVRFALLSFAVNYLAIARDIELAAATCEEGERVLRALLTETQDTIEESRALIAKIDEILAKRL